MLIAAVRTRVLTLGFLIPTVHCVSSYSSTRVLGVKERKSCCLGEVEIIDISVDSAAALV